jgi:hypothetical protein
MVSAADGAVDEAIVSGELSVIVAADEDATVPDEIDVAIVRECERYRLPFWPVKGRSYGLLTGLGLEAAPRLQPAPDGR